MKQKIIIDSDPGKDDAFAIMLAAKSNFFDIKAITTVSGNTTIENCTRNARYILKILDREDIPIYSGAISPLKRRASRATSHGESGMDGIVVNCNSELTGNATEKIISIIKENPYEVIIVGIGPMTNIAKAIEKDPKTMKKVKEIILMGGAIASPGNMNRVAEFNVFSDPEAADIVFKFPVKKSLIPLDVCYTINLNIEDFKKIKDKKIRLPLLKIVEPWIEQNKKNEGSDGALMFDALTIFYLMNRAICKTQKYDIQIETLGKLTRGMTVVENRPNVEKKYNTNVIKNIPKEKFRKDFINILSIKKSIYPTN